jgi:hypothetical protein
LLDGLNGPPWFPEEVKPSAGVTERVGRPTVRLTDLVVFPFPLVVFAKLTVSE